MAFAKGTRRAEEIISEARSLSYQENYSFTEGWNDNVAVDIINLALNRLYETITSIENDAYVEQLEIDVIATQQAYDLPIEVHMALRLVDVRYLYGTQPYEYITLNQGTVQDRFSYPTNIPDTYCIRDGQILLSPTPNITKEGALIINYQKRMRTLDIRRGVLDAIQSPVGTITGISNAATPVVLTPNTTGIVAGDILGFNGLVGMFELNGNTFEIANVVLNTSFELVGIDTTLSAPYVSGGQWMLTPMQFHIDFPTNSQKDLNMQANCDSVMDKVDYASFVDRYGTAAMNAIVLNGYNTTTQILTADFEFVPDSLELIAIQDFLNSREPLYLIQGDYASTHSQLDRQCEDHLIEYLVLRFLRLASNAEETVVQMKAEEAVLGRLKNQFRRIRRTIYPIIWTGNSYQTRTFPFGRRGLY